MADTTMFPILHTSPPLIPKTQTRKTSHTQPQRPRLRDASVALEGNGGVVKKKQSKSRNGCVTCKTKRLKCDEVKPTCEQCKRRNVVCEGYKRDFKWRPFEEPSCIGKRRNKARKGSSSSTALPVQPCSSYRKTLHDRYYDYTDTAANLHLTPPHSAIFGTYDRLPATSISYAPTVTASYTYATPILSPYIVTSQSISPIDAYTPFFQESRSVNGDGSMTAEQSEATAPSSVIVGHSPRLLDLLSSGADQCAPLGEHLLYRNQLNAIYQPNNCALSHQPKKNNDENSPKIAYHNPDSWPLIYKTPIILGKANFPAGFLGHSARAESQQEFTSPETISRSHRYDKCEVLSVKEGLTENSWQALVWPLARECSALYHAIVCLTYFQQLSQSPQMRIRGIEHMRTAIKELEEGMQSMPPDAAVATRLVLAFAESWGVRIGTGTNHIKGAKMLLDQALMQHRHAPKQGKEWMRLKLLGDTWIYMDVISRLTLADDDGEPDDVDNIYDSIHPTSHAELSPDPFMGLVHSLFLIIGRVAKLIQKIRRTNGNFSDSIAQAMDLKSQLEEWIPPPYLGEFENETAGSQDSIRAATAYQYATLLYLHQSVPSIPSLPALVLAKRALCELAGIEPSSDSCILHVCPLMAAGCEMIEEGDRAWVVERWNILLSRTKLGIMEKSLAATKEIWARRDAYAGQGNASEAKRNHDYSSRPFQRHLDPFTGHNNKDKDEDKDVCWLGSRPKTGAFGSLLPSSAPFTYFFE